MRTIEADGDRGVDTDSVGEVNSEKRKHSRKGETVRRLNEVAYTDIKKEFAETLGFIKRDIAAIRKADLGLNYTVALLISCGCEAMAKLQGRQGHDVFISLLPEAYSKVGKWMYEALRNGLVHGFRPKTITIGATRVRFPISWRKVPNLSVREREHLVLNVWELENRLIAKIDEYHGELRRSPNARVIFLENCKKQTTLEIPKGKASAWEEVLGVGRKR